MSDNIGIDFADYAEDRDTDAAYAVVIADGDDLPELHFFPKSLTTIYPKRRRLYAPEWLLTKKGLL